MYIRKELEIDAQNYKPKNSSIKTVAYSGFNFLHIDFYYNSIPIAWTQIHVGQDELNNENIELKIDDFNKIYFNLNTNAKDIIEEIVSFAHHMKAKKVFSRIFVDNNFQELESFYINEHFNIIHTPKEKSYDSAKIWCEL